MTLSINFFIGIFPTTMTGLECAAIVGVFTGQSWNMALSVYQSINVVPAELNDMASIFQLSTAKKFRYIELPYAIPNLQWNTMISQFAAWFVLVGTEAIVLGNKTIELSGLGSYIQVALTEKSWLHFYMIY